LKVVIQRVSQASVTIDEKIVAAIQNGLLVLVGIEDVDSQEDIDWLAAKVANIRIFGDENQVMNLSVKDIGGDVIVVSQFMPILKKVIVHHIAKLQNQKSPFLFTRIL